MKIIHSDAGLGWKNVYQIVDYKFLMKLNQEMKSHFNYIKLLDGGRVTSRVMEKRTNHYFDLFCNDLQQLPNMVI
uniref:CSON010639 protein n=1 Tax=Culicoides sonorensis TaxID=179676 RepID=A0A336M4M6_CULSO